MPKLLTDSQRDETLRAAIERSTPLQATLRADGHWTILHSKFLPRAAGRDFLCIEPPHPARPGGSDETPAELDPGTPIGVSFRRGHHKCLFNTQIAGRQRIPINATTRLDALLIRRPLRVDQLQRRAYERVPVPADHPIAAQVAHRDARSTTDAPAQSACAIVTDLSAGGAGLRFPTAPPDWAPQIGAEAQLELRLPGGAPLLVDAFYRQCWTAPDGAILWGYQFVGLESTDQGRATLETLSRLVRQLSHNM